MKKRKDGRFCQTVTDERTGKRLYFYGRTKQQVYQQLMEYEAKRANGRLFSEVAQEWWEEARERISPNSIKGYKVALRRALEKFSSTHVGDIKPKDIGIWLRSLDKLKLSYKTIKNHKIVVSRILQTAVMNGDIDYNPALQAEISYQTPQKKRLPASSEDEEKILNTADIWLLPYAALMSGLRKGELLALQWQDVDFEKNEISVTKSIYFDGNTPKIKKPKTEAGIRPVILLSELKEELMKRRGQPSEYIFSLDGGKTPYTEYQYDQLMRDYKRKTGVSATAHQLRKSFATNAAAAKVDHKVLQQVMGHSDVRTTLGIYASVHSDAWKDAKEALDAVQKKRKNND